MDIYFITGELSATCNSAKACCRRWGDQQAKVIMRRLKQLQQADTLHEVSMIGAAHLHLLVGDRRGGLAVSAKDGVRIVFESVNDPPRSNPMVAWTGTG